MNGFDWAELAVLDARLASLPFQQQAAEAAGRYVEVKQLAHELAEAEAQRERLVSRLINRIVDQAAA